MKVIPETGCTIMFLFHRIDKGVLKGGTNHAITLKIWQNHASRLDIWIFHVSRLINHDLNFPSS
jgi:hypothetical protein